MEKKKLLVIFKKKVEQHIMHVLRLGFRIRSKNKPIFFYISE